MRRCARKHLEAAPFGAITLDRLRPSDIEALVLALPRRRGLSDSTVRQVYTVLRLASTARCATGCWRAIRPPWWPARAWQRTEARHLDAGDVAAVLGPLRARGIPGAGADRRDRAAQG